MSIQIQKYKIIRVLNRDEWGKVYIVKDSQNLYAIKQINKSFFQTKQSSKLKRQIQFIKTINSENLFNFIREESDANYFYFFYQFRECINIFQYQSTLENQIFPIQTTSVIIYQIIKLILQLYSLNFYQHTILDYRNIFIFKLNHIQTVRIGFFSLPSSYNFPLNDRNFMPPQLLSIPSNPQLKLIDIWAIGVLLYYLLNNQYPFKVQSLEKMLQKCQPFSYKANIGQPLDNNNCNTITENMFKNIFEVNIAKRMTMDEIKQNLLLMNKHYEFKFNCVQFKKQIKIVKYLTHRMKFINEIVDKIQLQSKYLSKQLKFCLSYNILKFNIIQSRIVNKFLLQTVHQINIKIQQQLNWKKFFQIQQSKIIYEIFAIELAYTQLKFEQCFIKLNKQQNKHKIQEILGNSLGSSAEAFQDYKLNYRIVTEKAIKQLLDQSKLKQNEKDDQLFKLRVKLYLFHIINHIFQIEQLKTHFEFFFQWKPINDYWDFKFNDFSMWLDKQSRSKLTITINKLWQIYFQGLQKQMTTVTNDNIC